MLDDTDPADRAGHDPTDQPPDTGETGPPPPPSPSDHGAADPTTGPSAGPTTGPSAGPTTEVDPGPEPDDWGPTPRRPPKPNRPSTLAPNRRASALSRIERDRMHQEREDLFVELERIEAAISAAVAERERVRERLIETRDILWPRIAWQKGRTPPAIGSPPLAAATPNARVAGGSTLRQACLGVLYRYGPLSLVDIHSWLHRHGYVVDSKTPVKALADALGHEHDAGRAERIRRGFYGLGPEFRPDHAAPLDPLPTGDDPRIADPLVDPPLRVGPSSPAAPPAPPDPCDPAEPPTPPAPASSPRQPTPSGGVDGPTEPRPVTLGPTPSPATTGPSLAWPDDVPPEPAPVAPGRRGAGRGGGPPRRGRGRVGARRRPDQRRDRLRPVA